MSLVAWYPFTDDLFDHCGDNNPNMELSSPPIQDSNGKIGNTYFFNENYIFINNFIDENTKEFSFSFWCKPISIGTNQCFYAGRTIAGEGIAIFIVGSKFRFDYGNQWSINYTVQSNKWIHVAFVKKNNEKLFYLNGVLHSKTTFRTAPKNFYPIALIGQSAVNSDLFNNSYIGYLNDYRIYDHALTGKEINEIAKAKILHYTFNEKFDTATTNLYANYPDTRNLNNTNDSNIFAIKEKIGPGHFRYRIEKKVDGNYWPNVQFPVYAFEAGGNYSIGIDIKLIERKNQAQLELRHAAVNNDCWTDGRKSVRIENAPIGVWKRYNLTRTINSTYIQNETEYNTSPRMEIYTFMHKAGDMLEFEIKNYQVEKGEPTPFTPNNRTIIPKELCRLYQTTEMTTSNKTKWLNENNGCISLNSKSDYIKTNLLFNSLIKRSDSEITIAGWIKPTAIPSNTNDAGIILGRADYRGFGIGYRYWNESSIRIRVYHRLDSGNMRYTNEFIIPLNEWHHVAGILDMKNQQIKLYIDGILMHTQITSTGSDLNDNIFFMIGGEHRESGNGPWSAFKGCIRDVQVYATALSDEDIKLLYQPEISIDKSNTVRCNEIIENDQIIYENIFIQSASHTLVSKVDFKGISYAGSRSWNILCINKFLDVTCNKRYDIYNSGNYITELLNELDDFINNNEYCVIWTYDEPNNNSTNIRAKLKVLGATLTESNKWSHRCAYLIVFNKNKILDEKIIEGPSNIINTTLTLQGVSKYGFNKNASISYNEFNEIPKIESGIHNLKLGDEVLPVLIDMDNDGGRWARVFYHNCKAGTILFSSDNSFAEAKETNKNAPTTSNKYSILSKLEYFRFGNKTLFEFRLRYPTDYYIKTSNKRNKWIMKEYTNINYNNANRYPVLEDIKNKVPTSITIVEDTTNFLNSNIRNYFIQHYSSNVYCMNEKTITLGIQSDDTTTMYVNDKIITQVKNTGAFTNINFTLSAGWNKIDVLFYEQTGNEILKFNTMLSSLVDGMNYDIEEAQSCNIWKQLSNPTHQKVTGYKPIKIDWTHNNWKGLEYSGYSFALIDGSVNISYWHYAIGAASKHGDGIPSCTNVNNNGSTANDVELWVRINDYDLFNDNYIENVSISKNNIIAANEFIEINI